MDDGIACRKEAKELRNSGLKLESATLETEMIRFLGQHPGATLEDFLADRDNSK